MTMTTSDWWTRKLSEAPVAPSPHSTYPATQPRPVVIPQQQQAPVQSEEYRPQGAQHLRGAHVCPDCGSGNYMEQHGGKPRCFDCGYPVIQSTSGLIADPGTPTQAAEQVPTTYNPTIEGRLG